MATGPHLGGALAFLGGDFQVATCKAFRGSILLLSGSRGPLNFWGYITIRQRLEDWGPFGYVAGALGRLMCDGCALAPLDPYIVGAF